MKIKIVSDGTAGGTRIYNVDTNEPLAFENCSVVSVMWRVDPANFGAGAHVVLGLTGVPAELTADGDVQAQEARIGHG